MNLRIGGTALIFLFLAGCAAPMGEREAQLRASRSLRDFCAGAACGTPRMTKSQKIRDRWLVDFETAGGLYTVTVDPGGNTNVTVWDKSVSR